MKRILIILLSLLLVFPTSASLPIDVVQTVPALIKEGFDAILIGLSNDMIKLSVNSTVSPVNHTFNSMIVSSLGMPNNFLENTEVQKQKNFTAFWFVFFYIMFVICGAALIMKNLSFNSNNEYKSKFLEIAIGAPILYALYLYGLDYLFKFETMMSQTVILNIIDIVPPVTSNALAYFFIGLFTLLIYIMFYIRYILISIIVSYFLVIAMLTYMPIFGKLMKVILAYGFLFLFIRFLILLFFVGGMSGVNMLPAYDGSIILGYITLLVLVLALFFILLITPLFYLWRRSTHINIK